MTSDVGGLGETPLVKYTMQVVDIENSTYAVKGVLAFEEDRKSVV